MFGSFPVAEIIIIDDDKVGTFEFEDAVYSYVFVLAPRCLRHGALTFLALSSVWPRTVVRWKSPLFDTTAQTGAWL